jgi:hypothetical protein
MHLSKSWFQVTLQITGGLKRSTSMHLSSDYIMKYIALYFLKV